MNGINRQYAISVISKTEEIYLILKQFSRELISLSQSDEYFLDRMSKKFCKYGTVLAVFDRQQNVVGFAAYYDNDLQNKTGFLSMIAVELSAQKKGVGTLLLDEVEKRILNSGMLRLNLEVHKSNLPAISFYGKHGYLCIEDADISWIYQKEF
jgi:ribosomal protein S18 acetylase RimI-like enzyme